MKHVLTPDRQVELHAIRDAGAKGDGGVARARFQRTDPEDAIVTTKAKLRVAGSLGALALIAACSGSSDGSAGTAPADRAFDSERVEAGAAAVEKVSASSALSSLELVTRFGVDGAASTASRDVWAPGLDAAVRRLAASATGVGTHFIPILRPPVLGKTYVFDPALRRYVPDPTRTGAPSNGVRFILYDQTPDGDPILGREIGYADLTDEHRASPSATGVKLVVVTDGVTRLSYSIAVSSGGGVPAFDVTGFLVDGDDRLEFSVKATAAVLGSAESTVEATITAPKQGFEVKAKVTAKRGQLHRDGNVRLEIASASDLVVVDAVTVSGRLDATFTVNGRLLARATGDPAHPDIRGEGGRSLTAEELRALAKVVDMSDSIFDLLHRLGDPAGRLLLLAVALVA